MINEVFEVNTQNLIALNIIIATMMLGVSLELKKQDFLNLLASPKTLFVGLGLQLFGLPMLTCFIAWAFKIDPKLALGMFLIASCPGGSFSNVLTWMAKGNVAVSISMTAVSSLAASFMMPFNFAFYTWLNPYTRPFITEISINGLEVVAYVVAILVFPLMLGMFIGNRFPALSDRINKPLKAFAIACLVAIIAVAFKRHFNHFLAYIHIVFFLVLFHNAVAIALGYIGGLVFGLSNRDRRTISLEVGIQNGALAIVVILTLLPQESEMLLVAAFWGLWHLISGGTLAYYWSKKNIP